MKRKHYATIGEDLKPVLEDRAAWGQEMLNYKGKRVYFTVSKYSKSRSNRQNKYYWGVVIKMLADETGHSEEEMHEAMKLMFLKNATEERFVIARGTSSLTTTEFEEYMSKIRQWASQLLCLFIPDPNQVEF